jgi:hypothetical protein
MTYKSKTTDQREKELADLFDDWSMTLSEPEQIAIDSHLDTIINKCHTKGYQLGDIGAKAILARTISRMKPATENAREK